MGGTQGTTLSHVMRALPYGFPKVMVSTMASGNVGPFVDIRDITMMFSVTDILGLNPLARKILANAPGSSRFGHGKLARRNGAPRQAARRHHYRGYYNSRCDEGNASAGEDAGYETIVFHAIGPGGRAMEQLIREGIIGAVLDYSTIEVSNEMHHALLAGGAERLTTAAALGIPQVLAPGRDEVLVYNEPHTVTPPFNSRTLIRHSPQITDVRLNKEEMAEVGQRGGESACEYTKGDAVFMNSAAGFDSYAVAGEGFHDPEADAAFTDALRKNLPPNIKIVERNTHIDDAPAFATEAAETLIKLI